MPGFTNKGKSILLGMGFQNTDYTNLEVHLLTSASAPDADSNTISDHTEIADGNGYSQVGGYQLTRNATDFDNLTEGDSADVATIQIKDVVWTASGGPIPSAGDGARYAVLTTDDSNGEIIGYYDLVSDRSVSDTQTLTIQDMQMNLTET
jgi:hypothetical protein